jgi:hypothetical protein
VKEIVVMLDSKLHFHRHVITYYLHPRSVRSVQLLGTNSPAHRTEHTENKHTQTSMPRLWSEPTIQCSSGRRLFMR